MPSTKPQVPTIRFGGSADDALSDADAVDLARRGDAAALAVLYRRHSAGVFRLVLRLTGNASDAEDVLHDLFVGLPELLGRYEHHDRLGAWLRAVAAKFAIARFRRDRRHGDIAPSSETPAEGFGRHDPWTAVDMERAIAALSESERSVFVLRQLEGYSHDEIAALLDISPGASRVRYTRALKNLRHLLEPTS